MTTELLFRDDAYLKTASARVLAVHEGGIELDRTIFYPLGGVSRATPVFWCAPMANAFRSPTRVKAKRSAVCCMSRGAGRVRLLNIPGIDLQPCGGTHVRNIAEIGGIRVVRVRNEGKRNKRVEIVLA